MKHPVKFLLALGIAALSAQPLLAIQISVPEKNGGDTLVQGDTARWVISGITAGATVTNQVIMDVDSNGSVGPSDIVLLSFSETDGVSTGDGPVDNDGSANGVITTMIPVLAFPVGHLILVSANGVDTARATFVSAACPSPTYSISGAVTFSGGGGAPNVLVQANPQGTMGTWFVLTNASGHYTVATNAIAGSQWQMGIMDNAYTVGYVITPTDSTITLNANVTGFNFVLTPGKMITGHVYDVTGAPLNDISVGASPVSGPGGSQSSKTDGYGKYEFNVLNGDYRVQFGDQYDTGGIGTEGYVITYYRQKYVSWMTDTIHVTSATDTVKNIDDTLKKGGLIMGTMTFKGAPSSGCVQAYANNDFSKPVFSQCTNTGRYYMGILPGSYSIQFTIDTGSGQHASIFYNQASNPPGTAVTVNAIGDTVRNINADITPSSVKENGLSLVRQFALGKIYPNPFNESATVRYSLQRQSRVTMSVYNVHGQEVKTLVNTVQPAGAYQVQFSGEHLPSGIYLVKFVAGGFTATERLSLIKAGI